jgi:hypothetical protein
MMAPFGGAPGPDAIAVAAMVVLGALGAVMIWTAMRLARAASWRRRGQRAGDDTDAGRSGGPVRADLAAAAVRARARRVCVAVRLARGGGARGGYGRTGSASMTPAASAATT